MIIDKKIVKDEKSSTLSSTFTSRHIVLICNGRVADIKIDVNQTTRQFVSLQNYITISYLYHFLFLFCFVSGGGGEGGQLQ